MPEQKIDLDLKDVYAAVCPKCQKKVRALVREKIIGLREQALDDELDRLLEGKEKD